MEFDKEMAQQFRKWVEELSCTDLLDMFYHSLKAYPQVEIEGKLYPVTNIVWNRVLILGFPTWKPPEPTISVTYNRNGEQITGNVGYEAAKAFMLRTADRYEGKEIEGELEK